MNNCIFCKIAKKEIPANIIAEDDDFIAFLDINPLSTGHTLIIPKEHYRWVWDVENADEYFEMTKKVALGLKKAFNVEAIHSKIVGEEVHHAHIWVYPDPKAHIGVDKKDFENVSKILRQNL